MSHTCLLQFMFKSVLSTMLAVGHLQRTLDHGVSNSVKVSGIKNDYSNLLKNNIQHKVIKKMWFQSLRDVSYFINLQTENTFPYGLLY